MSVTQVADGGSTMRLAADQELVGTISSMVRKRVPPAEVDDIVQAALADAVASNDAPDDRNALRRWLAGVVRHKVADFHRRKYREQNLDAAPDRTDAPAHEDRDLLRWAQRQLPSPEAAQTLQWMMDEADGEKLEEIAEREQIPAPRVRQRVSRLRAFFRERWHRELALASLLVLLIAVGYVIVERKPHDQVPPIAEDHGHELSPAERLRGEAKDSCAKQAWRECLDKLDEAKALDPAGDLAPAVQQARDEATRALTPMTPPPRQQQDLPMKSKEVAPPKVAPTAAPSAFQFPSTFGDGFGSSSKSSSGPTKPQKASPKKAAKPSAFRSEELK